MGKPTKRDPAANQITHVSVRPEWGGFSRGDRVRITGERGVYIFIGHCQSRKTDEEWVALYGDAHSSAKQMFRYVYPDRVRHVPKKRKSS